MSRMVISMNVSISEKYFIEFMEELEEKGSVKVPFKTSEGILNLELTKIEEI